MVCYNYSMIRSIITRNFTEQSTVSELMSPSSPLSVT